MAPAVAAGMDRGVLEALLDVVVPVFAVAGPGFVYASRKSFPVGAVTDLIIHLTGACLVLDSLGNATRLSLAEASVPLVAVLLIGGGLSLGFSAHRLLPPLRGLPVRAVMLPVAFMNAGNLALPVAHLAFGDRGLEVGMLYFVCMATMLNSLGVSIIAGDGGAKVALRLPLLHAAWVGLVLNQLQVGLPQAVAVPVHMLGQTVVPMMLLSLGARLYGLFGTGHLRDLPWGPIALLVLLRMGGGLAIAVVVVEIMGCSGAVAQVAWLLGLMPPAVMVFALVEKFGGDPRASAIVSGSVAAGTVLAVVILPMAIWVMR